MMANGTDAEEKTATKVRPRLKRELEFLLRAHSEISAGMGRTRSGRSVAAPFPAPPRKRSKAVPSPARSPGGGAQADEVAESDIVELGSGDEEANSGVVIESVRVSEEAAGLVRGKVENRVARRSALKVKNEVEMEEADSGNERVKEVVKAEGPGNPDADYKAAKSGTGKKIPFELKELLDSGILEGTKLKYFRSSKTRASAGKAALEGVIKGSDILCFCEGCKGEKVVTPSVFELHARSLNKCPAEYIHLENGNTLRDVIDAWKAANVDVLDEALRISCGSSNLKKPNFCLNCRGPIGTRKSVVCRSCLELKEPQMSYPVMAKRNAEKHATPASCGSVSKSSVSRIKSQGKLTRKVLRLHKLLFEKDILPDGTEVGYFANGKKRLMGYKKDYGIVCSCCNMEVSPSQFEAHAGYAARRKPYLHIYTSNGVSLHELSMSLCKNRKISTYENDDLCQICQDGGDLICCNRCPRSFHQGCIDLPAVPEGELFCKYCLNSHQLDNGNEGSSNAVAAGRVSGVDPMERITRRCIRIVKLPGADFGGCLLCRDPDFEKGFGPRNIILCDQCGKEFHVGCLRDHKMADLKELPTGKWFCCKECSTIHLALQKMVIRGEEKLPDSDLGVIRKKIEEKSSEDESNVDVAWRLLSGTHDSEDAEGLLSAAIDIFHEQFSPIIHKRHHDIIPAMVKGGTTMEHEFTGMYCAVLLVNRAIVSAAIIRVFGSEVAELPLVATHSKCHRKGYFQALFNCLEKILSFLNVKNLVLPAAEEAKSIWTNKFGFNKIAEDQLLEYRKFYELMVFEGTSVLQKAVPKCLHCWQIRRLLTAG